MQGENRYRALLTGATGFIGSRLASALIKKGWEVHAILRPASNMAKVGSYLSEVRIHRCEASYESLKRAVEQSKPNIVLHLATHFLHAHTSGDIDVLIRSNIEFGAYLLQALAETSPAPLVNVGTSWQYYDGNEYNPSCFYAATKQAFEDILKYYVNVKSQKAITLALTDTYGPWDPREKLFYHLKKAAIGKTPLEMSEGEQKLDLVYIDDVVSAFIAAAHHVLQENQNPSGKIYRISSGKLWSLREVVCLYEEAMGCSIAVNWGARPYRDREVMLPWTGGEKLPNWEPRVMLASGLAKMAQEDGLSFQT